MTRVVAVHLSGKHAFSKETQDTITLVENHGVEGDAHAGATVRHRSRVRRNPDLPNLRQVHLMPKELLDELDVAPGALGENDTTEGIDLIALSAGTRLRLGEEAVVEVTGLRNPCVQIEDYRDGLLARVIGHDADGSVVRRTGVMSVVVSGGVVRAGDAVEVHLPAEHVPLQVV
jgi:MOSC domain-containing protein YiiM